MVYMTGKIVCDGIHGYAHYESDKSCESKSEAPVTVTFNGTLEVVLPDGWG